MMNSRHFLYDIHRNWKSGITVSLISIPLSLSLAVAAGATPVMGVITAIWAGLFAALLGGSRYNVTGPTGALSGILAVYALTYGAAILPLLAVLSGVVILVFFLLHWERYIVFIPSSVTHGFTLGVAFIISLNQLNFALGLTGLPQHEKLWQNVIESLLHFHQVNPGTFALFAGSLIVLFALRRFLPAVPGPIIVSIIGIACGYAAESGSIGLALQTLADKYPQFDTRVIALPTFTWNILDMNLAKGVFAISLVAILETLLSGKIADGMTKTKFNQRREVFGLGIANLASGLTGGIPATAALARTALNIKTGATSKASAAINAIFVLIIAALLFGWFQYLPLAIVASILVYVAIRMVEAEHFRHLYHLDKKMCGLSMVVAAITVLADPIVGILVGATVSLLIFVEQLSRGQSEISVHRNAEMVARMPAQKHPQLEKLGDTIVYRIAGELTYFNGLAHSERIKTLRGYDTMIISLRNLFYIDLDGIDTLQEIIEEGEADGKEIILSSIGEFVEPLLARSGWFGDLIQKKRVFPSTTAALNALGFPKRTEAER